MEDFSNMNHLSAETKILIVNGQALVEKTRETMQKRRTDVDLTGRFQLKDDCKAVEKCIRKLGSKKASQRDVKELELAVIRLQTSAGALLNI